VGGKRADCGGVNPLAIFLCGGGGIRPPNLRMNLGAGKGSSSRLVFPGDPS